KSDSDTYSCDIGDAQSRAKLTVQEALLLHKGGLVDAEVTEGEDVSLQCETSRSDTPEKWCKDGKSIRNSSKYNIRQSGFEAKLVIHRAEEKDS
ncbi:OBSCN protein, partial [Prunella himalayana]|nr:OBSCN protein [Prunella himalayana]